MPLWQKGNVGEFQFPIIFYIVFVYYRVLVKLEIYLKKAFPSFFHLAFDIRRKGHAQPH